MARYIDADKMLEDAIERRRFVIQMEDMANREYVLTTVYRDLYDFIQKQPTADVVEVVRCRDCIMSREDRDDETLFCMLFRDTVDEQAYCSYGISPERSDAE